MSQASAPLRRVVYVSHAIEDPALPQTEVIARILDAARRNNPRVGVTGALLFSARRYAQVLEGPPEAVEELFETIQCDLRHDHVSVLEVTSPPERAFADWSMAFVEESETASALLDQPDGAGLLVKVLQAAIRNTEAATA